MNYASGGAFRRALEDRLRSMSLQDGVPLVRLRKLVAFDRFLARLILFQPDSWVVKGGLALQLRIIARARTTKDMDLLHLTPGDVVSQALRGAAALDLGDWFSFTVAQASEPHEAFGGVRHPVQTYLDGRIFESFHIDVGMGDPMLEPADPLSMPPLLEFAGLKPACVPCFPVSQQIAEKLHAYTRPHLSGESSRVKDFVDILLPAELGNIRREELLRAVQATFLFASTHNLPTSLPPPPRDWVQTYAKLAEEVGLGQTTLSQAYADVQRFLEPLLKNEYAGPDWDPVVWTWK